MVIEKMPAKKPSCLLPFALLALLLSAGDLAAQSQSVDLEVGIDEKLGEFVPLDLTVFDETGEAVLLSEFVDRPTILALVYYRCPDICSPLLMGLADAVEKMGQTPGEDFRILTVSFSPVETGDDARHSLEHIQKMYSAPWPAEGWIFTTTDSSTIATLTDAVGFRYKQVGVDQFTHAGAITVLSPQGQVARYLYGITYLPFDIKMALTEAAEGRVGPTINRVLLFCFSYDPEGQTYVFNMLKVTGTLITLFALFFVAWLVISARRSRRTQET